MPWWGPRAQDEGADEVNWNSLNEKCQPPLNDTLFAGGLWGGENRNEIAK